MKNHVFILFILPLYCLSQNVNAPFVGTWEWENNDQIFRVILYLNEEGRVRGDFEMVEDLGNNQESLIYESKIDTGNGLEYDQVIYGQSDGNRLGAGITDNTINHPYGPLFGELIMVIQPSHTPGLTTATW